MSVMFPKGKGTRQSTIKLLVPRLVATSPHNSQTGVFRVPTLIQETLSRAEDSDDSL